MKSYKYIARDSSGARKEALIKAVSANDVLGWLRTKGFIPISVHEIAGSASQGPRGHRGRIKSNDLSTLCWQLTTMVEGGVAITTAVETVAEDLENLHLQQVLQNVLELMRKGKTLSESFSAFPKVFNHLFCAMIVAGEAGGALPLALRRLAEYFDNRDKLSKKIKSATAYPIFAFSFVILIVIFIMAFVVPRFRVIFKQIGGELPAFTQAFMGFYDILRTNILYIIGGFLLLIILSSLSYTKTRRGHYIFSRLILGMPLLGKVFVQAFVATFCRTMSTLITAGVPVLEAFDILSKMTGNDVIKSAIERTREHIVGGSNISISMAATGFFPNMVVKMIQAGEESGSLSKMLDRASDYYERKVDATVSTLTGLLEPIMIVTIGAIVTVVLLALYLPIFTMSNVSR